MATVSVAFLIATVGTMMLVVYLLSKGLRLIRMNWLERWMHVLAGVLVLLSGLAIVLGL